jgi:hypothetical protein
MAANLEYIFIATILTCFVLVAGTTVINDFDTNYNLSISQGKFAGVINKATNVSSQSTVRVEAMRDKLIVKEISIASATDILFSGAYTTLSLIWSFFSLPAELLTSILDYFGLPPMLGGMIFAILSISMIFSVIYLIMKFEPK